MAPMINHQPLITEAQVPTKVSPSVSVVDKLALGQHFLRVLDFSPVIMLYVHSFISETISS